MPIYWLQLSKRPILPDDQQNHKSGMKSWRQRLSIHFDKRSQTQAVECVTRSQNFHGMSKSRENKGARSEQKIRGFSVSLRNGLRSPATWSDDLSKRWEQTLNSSVKVYLCDVEFDPNKSFHSNPTNTLSVEKHKPLRPLSISEKKRPFNSISKTVQPSGIGTSLFVTQWT